MRSIKEFLHPLWRKSFNRNLGHLEAQEVNNAILDAIDTQLNQVEADTVASKAQLFLNKASDEWLDYWGSWFGLKREPGQNDVDYRKALIYHVEHPRNTIPALREAIAQFLKTGISDVHIYEPWQDIFILNDSLLNSDAHLSSDYYSVGVMDISIAKPFNADVIDIINWFRPAGTVFVLTYSPGDSADAPIFEMPPANADLRRELLTIETISGLQRRLNVSMNPDNQDGTLGQEPFILNDSLLNSSAVLLGAGNFGSGFYHRVGTLQGLIQPDKTDTVNTIADQMDVLDSSVYYRIKGQDASELTLPVDQNIKVYNLLTGTFDFTSWSTSTGNYLSDAVYQTRSVMEFVADKGSTHSIQTLALKKGVTYQFSADLKADRATNVNVTVDIDSDHVNQSLVTQLTPGYQRFTYEFTYDGGTSVPIKVSVDGNVEKSGTVYLSGIMLREKALQVAGWDTVIPDWTKSFKDYKAELNSKIEYVYLAFDYRNFFYGNIEDQVNVKLETGFDVTNDELNAYMDDYTPIKTLVTDYRATNTQGDNVHAQLMLYDFSLGMWVNYQDDNLTDHNVNMQLRLRTLKPYLNDSGMMLFAVSLTSINHTYQFEMNDFQLIMDRTFNNQFAYQMYAEDGNWGEALELDIEASSEVKVDTRELVDREQQYFPMRFIRNRVRDIKFNHEDHLNGKGLPFTLNDSLLNSLSYIPDQQTEALKLDQGASYVQYTVQPKMNEKDTSLPVESVSILGANINDPEHRNVLSNLLPGGIFTSDIETAWNALGESTKILPVSINGKSGYNLSNETEEAYAGVKFRSDDTFFEDNYRFSFSGQSTTTDSADCTVNVYLTSNEFRYLALTKTVTLTSDLNQYLINFDTNKVFPDSIEIEIIGPATAFNLNLFDPDLRLDVRVQVDGGNWLAQNAPDLYPLTHPLKGQPIVDLADATSTLTYDDIQFNLDSDPIHFDDGTVTRNLNYSDLKSDPNLATYAKLKPATADNALTYLKTLGYYLVKNNDKQAYDYQTLLDKGVNWLNLMGYGLGNGEHMVTIDLGKVHTDISELLVQHGSDSDTAARYESCVETSVDGIHWHSWYDNYRDSRGYLDPFYQEPLGRPKAIPVDVYNQLAYRVDVGKPYEKTAEKMVNTEQGVIAIDQDYGSGMDMSAVAERYPAFALADFVLGADAKQSILWLNSGTLMGLKTKLGKIYSSVLQQALISPADKNNLQSTTTTTSTSTTTSTTLAPNTTTTSTTTIAPSADLFMLNERGSVLNGDNVLAKNQTMPVVSPEDPSNPHSGSIPVAPNVPLNQTLIEYDVIELVQQRYPDLWGTLGLDTREKQAKFIQEWLVGSADTPIMRLNTLAASSSDSWSISLWNPKQQGTWSNTQTSYDDGPAQLTLSATTLMNVITSDGYIYALVTANQIVDLKDTILFLALYPQGINDYACGLYPHRNLAIAYDTVKVFGDDSDNQVLKAYQLDPASIGRKVRVSFNVVAAGNTGTLEVGGNGFNEKRVAVIEQDHQHYSFIATVDSTLTEAPTIEIIGHNTVATLWISAFKVEFGETESPHVSYSEALV